MIWDSNPSRVKRFFSFLICSPWLCGPPSLLIGCWCSFPRVKQPGHEVDHLALSSDKFENEWSYTFFSPPVYLHGVQKVNLASLPRLHFTREHGGRMSFQNIGARTVSYHRRPRCECFLVVVTYHCHMPLDYAM